MVYKRYLGGVFTVSICADAASSELVIIRSMSHVKVYSPGKLRCALIHAESRGVVRKLKRGFPSRPRSSSFQDSETEIKPEANVSTRTWLARLFQLNDKDKI